LKSLEGGAEDGTEGAGRSTSTGNAWDRRELAELSLQSVDGTLETLQSWDENWQAESSDSWLKALEGRVEDGTELASLSLKNVDGRLESGNSWVEHT
jgi:hypothetical protein